MSPTRETGKETNDKSPSSHDDSILSAWIFQTTILAGKVEIKTTKRDLKMLLFLFILSFICIGYFRLQFLAPFWLHPEMRFMVAACVVILFSFLCFNAFISEDTKKPDNRQSQDLHITHTHIFEGGKSYSPIRLELNK